MVGGGFLGRKCVGVKNEIVVGRHPVGPWWKPWIIIWMFWVVEVWVLFSQTFAERQSVAESLSVHLSLEEQSDCPPKRAYPYSLELNLTNFTYMEASVSPRSLLWGKKDYLWGRDLQLEGLGEHGSWDAGLRGVPRITFMMVSPLWWLHLSLDRGAVTPKHGRQSPLAPTAIDQRKTPVAPYTPLCGGCQGTQKRLGS